MLACIQAAPVSSHCKSTASGGTLPDPTAWTGSPADQTAIDTCGGDLTSVVHGNPSGTLDYWTARVQAASDGLAALQRLQQHSLTTDTTVGGLRTLYNDLIK